LAENKENEERVPQSKPTPIVLSINICDNIIRDEATKKVSLIGLFSTIRANIFPCNHPQMHVYIALTNGHGKYKSEIRFLDVERKPIVSMVGEMNFQNPLQIVELNMCWQQLRFDKQGEYTVEVLFDGEIIQTRKFRVIAPQQEIYPTFGTEAR
jgi:hypothetical protein